MNARLQMRLLRRREFVARRGAVLAGALIESMNVCDTTRAHELLPSQRFASRNKYRRASRRIGLSLLLLLAVCVLAAIASPRSPSEEPSTIPVASVE